MNQHDANEPKTFLKMLSILEAFTINRSRLTTSQIAHRCGISTSTIYRYLSALENHGYITREAESGKYMLGLKMIELGGIATAHMTVRYRGQIVLDQLSSKIGLNTHMSVLYQGDIMHIAYSVHEDYGPFHGIIGRRSPAHCTAMGKVLLASLDNAQVHKLINTYGWRTATENSIKDFPTLDAELEKIRTQGYATEFGEFTHSIGCVAYPVISRSNEVVAAISASAYTYKIKARLEQIGLALREHAERLSYDLGYFGSYPFIR